MFYKHAIIMAICAATYECTLNIRNSCALNCPNSKTLLKSPKEDWCVTGTKGIVVSSLVGSLYRENV